MTTKTVSVNFYRGQEGPDDRNGEKFKAVFEQLQPGTEWLHDKNSFGLTCLSKDTDHIFGELKHYRDDAPHIGAPQGQEKEIPMAAEEHVIEKVFYLYSLKHNVLLLQLSSFVHSPSRVAEIATLRSGNACFFAPLIRDDALDRLAHNIADSRKVVCSFAIPAARAMSPVDDWSDAAMTLSEGATGRMTFTISGNMRGTDKEPLEPGLVTRVLEGVKSGLLDKAKVYPVADEPIDLLSDRLTTKIDVEMNGRYPQQWSVSNGLKHALQDHEQTLAQY